MAIYGIGAYWDGTDMTEEFINDGKACIGWTKKDSLSLYEILRHVKMGDLIYIKSAPPGGFYIKAIGIILDGLPFNYDNNTSDKGCIKVNWFWTGVPLLITVSDRYNVRTNTFYEEHNTDVKKVILEKLVSIIKP